MSICSERVNFKPILDIQDNGVKIVDPRGEMLESSWEAHATALSNAPTTDDFIDALDTLIQMAKIDISKPSRVVYARDTRPSGIALVAALEDGLSALGTEGRNAGVTTTPILHYLVRSINTKDTLESYGDDSEEGYFQKLGDAFKNLVVCRAKYQALLYLSYLLFSQEDRHSNLYSLIVPTELVLLLLLL